jgi:murein DD-endopeptidase MepM/ murein hydrolase activator NlpD
VGVGACAALLATSAPAGAYPWPVKPFGKPHAIRGAFDDPRFHLGTEGALSAFHFGVDIAARDGTPVYSVSPGFVRRHATDVTVRRPATGRAFGYWHIRPVVRPGRHVRIHQLLGYVLKGWGHVHFAESVDGVYRNPLRRGALAPFRDRTGPTVASIGLVGANGAGVNPAAVRGIVDVESEVYDAPPIAPQAPWQVARLTPAFVWWKLWQGSTALTDWNLAADFHFALMPESLYNWVYAPGTYQNKANRPGHYLFWVTHGLDTTTLADGRYRISVLAEDTHFNSGTASLDFTVANGAPPVRPVAAPGMSLRQLRPF